jgi:transposase InsO family protein
MKWTNKPKRTGRPSTAKKIEALIVRFARDNPRWGYRRIQGALYNLRHVICPNTVKRVLGDHGIEPAPKRQTTWKQFLSAHWDTLAATDFFSTEVWTLTGLRTVYTLFVIDLASRRIHIVGSTHCPNELFMHQAALALTGFDDSPLKGATHLIMDRDTKYTKRFREVLQENGVEPVLLPPRSPNLNAQAERFKRSIKSVRLDHLIFFGPATLDHALREYAAHYNGERNQQGLGNRLLTETPKIGRGRLLKPGRLGGLLNWFIRLLAPVAGRGKRRRLPQTGRPSVFPWFFSGFGSAAFL